MATENPLGVRNQMVRHAVHLVISAAVIYVGWLLYDHSVWLGNALVLPFCILMALAFTFDYRVRKRLRKSCAMLATLTCPTCGTPFGVEVARLAFVPPPRKPNRISDDFGYSDVRCMACNGQFVYHRHNMALHPHDFNILDGAIDA